MEWFYSAVSDQIRPFTCFQFLTNMIPSAAECLCKPSVSHTQIQRYCCQQQQQQQAIFSKLQGVWACACVNRRVRGRTCVYTQLERRILFSHNPIRYLQETQQPKSNLTPMIVVLLLLTLLLPPHHHHHHPPPVWAASERAFQVISNHLKYPDGWQASKVPVNDRWCVEVKSKRICYFRWHLSKTATIKEIHVV